LFLTSKRILRMDGIHSPILAAFRKAHDAHDAHDVSLYSCLTFDVQQE